MTNRSTTGEETAAEIDDAAAAWALRIHDGGLSPESDPGLRDWLAGDRRHSGALLRAEAALSLLDRARALKDAPDPAPDRRNQTRRAMIAASAAGFVAVGAGVGILETRSQRYRTQLGEIRRVPLQDGSLVAINTHTALDVAMRSDLRRVSLLSGEAWFEVAKDPARPFVVEAGPVRVRAVGTAFSVRAIDGGARVMVTEGVVETWLAGETRRARVSAGSKTLVSVALHPAVISAAAEIERDLSWRNGEIALDGESLAEAAREFNRYNQRQIVIDDPTLANMRFVGLFRTNEPESFAAAVVATGGVQLSEDATTIRLRRMT